MIQKKTIDPLLSKEAKQIMHYIGKAEVFSAFLASAFTAKVNCDKLLNPFKFKTGKQEHSYE